MSSGRDLPDMVVLDTCVLLSAALHWLLLRLASDGCFRPVWSPVIGDEWQRNVARVRGVDKAAAQGEWDAMQQRFPHASQNGIEPFKSGLRYSDAKDWHVIAAGRAAAAAEPGARVAVLTRNLKDFNRSELRRLGLDLIEPDRFLVQCLHNRPALVIGRLAGLPDAPGVRGRDGGGAVLNDILRRERLFRLGRLMLLPGHGASFPQRQDA